jgi:hypothetical protein
MGDEEDARLRKSYLYFNSMSNAEERFNFPRIRDHVLSPGTYTVVL